VINDRRAVRDHDLIIAQGLQLVKDSLKTLGTPAFEANGVVHSGGDFFSDQGQAVGGADGLYGGQLAFQGVHVGLQLPDVLQELGFSGFGINHGGYLWGGVRCSVTVINDRRAVRDHAA